MTVLWRLHLRSLLSDWRSALAILGLAVGTALVVAVSVLATETGRPFETTGTLVRPPAAGRLLQIEPAIQARLPVARVDQVARLDGVTLAAPVMLEPTPLLSSGRETGVVLVAVGDCAVASVMRVDPCADARSGAPNAGPGAPISLSRLEADQLGVGLGDPLALPGGRNGDAHVGWIRTGTDPVDAGLAIVANLQDAQRLLGRAGTATMAFAVVTDDVAQARVEQAVAPVASAGPPQPAVPTALVTVRQTLSSMRVAGVIVGSMIAISTLLLALDARRRALATAMLLGSSSRRLMAGFAVEGAILGALGGLIGLPLGHLAGTILVDQFGSALLEGTGARLATTFEPSELALAVGAGVAAGLIAVLLSARSVVRAGILANLDSNVGGRAQRRTVAWWLVPVGLAMIAVGALVLAQFGRGSLPFSSGQGGLATALFGVILITLALAPRAARAAASAISTRFGAIGLTSRAEVDRLPIRTAAAVTVLATGLAMAVTFSSIGELGSATATDRFAAVEPGGLLVASQQPWDQREGVISDATAAAVRAVRGVTGVTERWRAIVSSPTEPRLVVALDGPGAARAVNVVGGSVAAVGDDRVALSRVAAGRLRAAAGDHVELPTLDGPASFAVTGVFDPVAVDDSTVGDWVLVSPETARNRFGAVRSQLAVDVGSSDGARAVAGEIRRTVPGVQALDRAGWDEISKASWARWFRPFAVTGYLIAAAGGIAVMNMLLLSIIQQRRTRAALRAIGQRAAGERRTLLVQALVLAGLAIVFGVLWSPVMTWLLSLSSPVFYGFQLDWGVVGSQLAIGVAITAAFVAVSVLAPIVVANRLDVAKALSAE